MIADALGAKVSVDSYYEHTGISHQDRADGLTQSYLRKDGHPLDLIAMNANYSLLGDYDTVDPVITTDMIVDFMHKYPRLSDYYSFLNKSGVEIDLEEKFRKLTGLSPVKANIDLVLQGKKESGKTQKGEFTSKPSETTDTSSETEVNLPETDNYDDVPFHKGKDFTSIPKKAFDKLIGRLLKAFPKMKGKIIADGKAMRDRLNELKEKGYDIVVDEKINGFVDPENGRIYMDDARMNANTPIHEFGHIWTGVLEAQFPVAHKKLIDAVKRDKKAMDAVRNDPAYKHLKTDEQIADEALARFIGDKGEQKFLKEEGLSDKERSIRQRIFDEIQRIWEGIKKYLGKDNKDIRKWTSEQWNKATLNDLTEAITGELLGGKNIEKKGVDSKIEQQQKELGVSFHLLNESDFNADGTVKQSVLEAIAKEEADIVSRAKADGTYMKAPNGKKSNLNEKQWVQVRTQRFKDWFGDWEIEADLLHLFQNNKFDYEKLKNVARRIQAERARVNGKTEARSRETNGASSRNDEASLIAEAKRRAERQTKISYEARTWAEHAKRTGKYIDNIQSLSKSQFPSGHESEVYESKNGETVMVATRSHGILVKRLHPAEEDNKLRMVSDNKDYPPFDVNKEEITGIALVVGVIRLE